MGGGVRTATVHGRSHPSPIPLPQGEGVSLVC